MTWKDLITAHFHILGGGLVRLKVSNGVHTTWLIKLTSETSVSLCRKSILPIPAGELTRRYFAVFEIGAWSRLVTSGVVI